MGYRYVNIHVLSVYIGLQLRVITYVPAVLLINIFSEAAWILAKSTTML